MKVLLAIALVAVCGLAEAKDKPVANVTMAPNSAAVADASNTEPRNPKRGDGAAKVSAPKHEASRDPYSVPLLREARSIR